MKIGKEKREVSLCKINTEGNKLYEFWEAAKKKWGKGKPGPHIF